MNRFRITKKPTLYFWVALLSFALICAQGVKYHIHSLDHDHHNHDDLQGQLTTSDHAHISIAHLSLDNSHSDHHDQVIYESEACPDCLLTKISSKLPFTALLAALLVLLLSGYRHTYMLRRDVAAPFSRRCHFTPPLRAPPLI